MAVEMAVVTVVVAVVTTIEVAVVTTIDFNPAWCLCPFSAHRHPQSLHGDTHEVPYILHSTILP